MATPLNLLKAFATGNASGDITNYFTYAPDHDSNYTSIEATVNQLIAELLAVQGPNAALFAQVLELTDPLYLGVDTDSIVGEHSYRVTIGAPTTELDVSAGVAIVNGIKVSLASPGMSIVGPGGASAWHYVALDANGIPSIEVLPGLQVLDVARVQWTTGAPGSYGGTVFQESEVSFDGDEFARMRRRAIAGDPTTPTFPALDQAGGSPFTRNAFRHFADRVRDIENILAGVKVGQQDGTTLGAIIAAGNAAAPGIATLFGGTYYLGTGIFPAAANALGVSIAGTELLRFLASAIRANADGSNTAPFYSFVNDAGMGAYRIANDRLGFATNQVLGLELSDYQQPTSPTAFRFRVTTAAEPLSSSAGPSAISMDAEVTDVGGFGTAPTASWVVPTGGAGFYFLGAHCYFDESSSATPNVGVVRRTQITVQGTVVADELGEPQDTANEDTAQSVATCAQLAAGDAIQLRAAQDSGNNMNVNGHLAAVRIW
jgi:hypothetical protein